MEADGTFVGRHREGARLVQLVDDAGHGQGGSLAVMGEAGVGKSALLDRIVAQRPGGMVVVRVTGIEVESDLAHVGVATLVAQAGSVTNDLDAATVATLRAVVGPGSPSGRGAGSSGDGTSGGAGGGEEGSPVGLGLHMATLALVTALAARQPVLVVLDDVQWIDTASLGVLAFVARRVHHDPVAVVLAGRPSPDLDDALAGIDRLDLSPLDPEEARVLLAGHGVVDTVASACWQATGGNPLALVELVAALGPDERSGRSALPDPIPVAGPIRDVFARRLAPLADVARRALGIAAVEATGAPAVVVAALAAVGLGQADLGPAEDAGFIHRSGDGVRWAHPLARAAVIRSLAPGELRAAHRSVASALAGQSGAGVDARVAHHLAAAAEGPDEAVAERLDQVARLSTERGALRAAAVAWASAAALSVDDAAGFERRLAGLYSLWLAGETEAVLTVGRPLVASEPDPVRRARLAMLVGQATMFWDGPPSGARFLTSEADRARPADPTTSGYLYLYAAQCHLLAADPGAVVAVAERAGAEGMATGDMGVALMAQAFEGFGRLLIGQDAQARTKLDPLVDLSPGLLAAGIEGASALAQVLGYAQVAAEEWTSARRLIAGVISEGERSGHIGMTVLAHDQMADLEWRQGRWAEAAARITHALTLAEGQDQDQPVVHLGRVRLARIDAGRGRTAAARPPAAAALALARRTGWRSLALWTHEVLALADLADGEPAAALRHLDAMAVLTGDTAVRHPGMVWWQAVHIETLVAGGRTADAAAALDVLRSGAADAGGLWPRAAVARGEAAVAAAGDDLGRAVEQLGVAADLMRRLGAGFELALVLLARGRCRQRLGPGPEHAEAAQAATRDLAEAHARFVQLDARPWAERAARLAGPASAPRPQRSLAAALTDAEMRVALVVGNGATNRQAADRLFLSVKTVDSHLQSIYRRLDIRSRSQLAGLVARELGPDA